MTQLCEFVQDTKNL